MNSDNSRRSALYLSIVIPVHNEEKIIDVLVDRVTAVLNTVGRNAELIFVDDGSYDATCDRIRAAYRKDVRIKLLRFSRNFGHQRAITAGLDFAEGNAVVIIDGDLQDPPELIPQLLEQWSKGFEVVHAVRSERQGESLFKKLTAAVFYRLLKKMTNIPIAIDSGDFRLIDRKVVLALRSLREGQRFLRGLVNWAGFRQTSVFYVREARHAGETKFSIPRMMRFAIDAITSFSIIPLQQATLLGGVFSVSAFLSAVYIAVLHLFTGRTVTGWSSLMIAVLFFGGVQLLFLGILGEYVGRIFEEVKGRPLYLISQREGFDDATQERVVEEDVRV